MSNKLTNPVTIGIFVLHLTISQNVFSFSGGINGYSGNPATSAGNTCSTCHSGGATPTVNLTGPATVQPGTISTFTFTISGGQQNSGGLDISADGGTLINTLASTRLQVGEIIHNQRATAAGDGTVSWSFDWQAPTILGSYTIYGAGLSANGDSNTTLDGVSTHAYVVTVSSAAPQSPTAVILAPMTAQVSTTVSFDGAASFDPDGIINQYEWNFGDGNTASGAQTTNSFSAAGTYTVTLIVTDSDNLTSSTFRDITVGGVMVPIANPGGPYTGIEGQAVNFDGSLSSHVEPITSYIWDFGDGSAVVQDVVATVSHSYNQPGAYTVTLAVQDANVITGVASTTVVIDATAPPPTDGPTLYANNCAACHGPLDSSSKLNRTASQIQSAIDANIGGMGGLSGLTPTQVQAIADALASVTPPPVTGQELYDAYCLACHGPGGKGGLYEDVTGESASEIADAINKEPLMNSISLNSGQIQSIADYLSGSTPPPPATDGPTLYANNCAACHGVLASSTKLNKTASQIQAAIDANTGGMGGLSSLTPTEVQAIADALAGGGGTQPPPTTGEEIYAVKCAVCHGPGGTGGSEEAIVGASLSEIQKAMLDVTEMQSIPLTNGEAQALKTYLSESNGMGGGGHN